MARTPWLTVGCLALALVGGAAVARLGWVVPVGVLGLGVLGAVCLRRSFGLFLLLWFSCALIPHGNLADLTFRRWLSVPVHPIDLLYWVSIAVWVVHRLAIRRSGPPSKPRMFLAGPVLATVVVIAVSILVGVANGQALWDLVRDLRNAALWLMLPIAWVELDSDRRIRQALTVIVCASILYAMACGVISLMPDAMWPRSAILAHWRGSARIYFHNHFVFLTVLPLVVGWAASAPTKRRGLLRALPAPLIVWATWASVTRSLIVVVPATAALTLLMLAFVVPGRGRFARPVSVAFGALLIFGIGGLAVRQMNPRPTKNARTEVVARFEELVGPTKTDISLRGRIKSYRFAFEDATESPVYGHGMGALLRVPWANQLSGPGDARVKGFQPAVDNAPLTLLVKAGVLGLAVGVWLVLAVLVLQLRAVWRSRHSMDRAWIPAALFAGTVGIVVISQLQATLLTSRYIILFSVFAAVSDRYAAIKR